MAKEGEIQQNIYIYLKTKKDDLDILFLMERFILYSHFPPFTTFPPPAVLFVYTSSILESHGEKLICKNLKGVTMLRHDKNYSRVIVF